MTDQLGPIAGDVQVDYLKAALYEIVALMNHLVATFPRRIPKQKWPVIALFLAIAESIDSIALLFANGRLNQIPALLRGVVDTLYDLKLLNLDPDNINLLNAKALTEEIKRHHLRLGPDSQNVDLRNDPKKVANIKAKLAEAQRQLDALKERGFTAERYSKKYETLDAKYFKGIVFSTLSGEAHNSIDVLLRRHIALESDRKLLYKYQIKHELDEYQFTFFNVSLAALDATSIARKILDVEFRAELARMVSLVGNRTGRELQKFNWYGYEE